MPRLSLAEDADHGEHAQNAEECIFIGAGASRQLGDGYRLGAEQIGDSQFRRDPKGGGGNVACGELK